jgi:hypothetical protein
MKIGKHALGIAVAMAFSAAHPGYAQTQQYTGLVLKGGLASAALQSGAQASRAHRDDTGFAGGIALTFTPYMRLGLQTEVLLNERRSPSAASAPVIVVPFLLRARITDIGHTRISFLLGPEVAASATRNQGIVQESDDYGMDLGIDFDVRHHTLIDVRYTRGLVTLGEDAAATDSARTHGLTVMVGWRIH